MFNKLWKAFGAPLQSNQKYPQGLLQPNNKYKFELTFRFADAEELILKRDNIRTVGRPSLEIRTGSDLTINNSTIDYTGIQHQWTPRGDILVNRKSIHKRGPLWRVL